MNELKQLINEAYYSLKLTGLESVYNPAGFDLADFFVQEIAGRDSIAALNAYLQSQPEQTGVILSVAFAPTEFGNPMQLYENTLVAYEIAQKNGLKVAFAASRDVDIWRELNGKSAFKLSRKYGFYTPCIGCHAYLHLLRALIAVDTGASIIVSGERISHQGRFKINQDEMSISAYREVLAEFGIDFVTPIAEVSSDDEIASLLPFSWKEGELQMSCLYSGNSTIKDENVLKQINEARIDFLKEFLMPAMRRIILDYREG